MGKDPLPEETTSLVTVAGWEKDIKMPSCGRTTYEGKPLDSTVIL